MGDPRESAFVAGGGDFVGRVERISYEGASDVVTLAAAPGQVRLRISASERPQPGARVAVAVPGERLRLFRDGRRIG